MFWVRPWSTSPSAAPAAADQLARCPLPVFGWPMAPGGLPWSMPPDLAQNYAKFASQNHIASRVSLKFYNIICENQLSSRTELQTKFLLKIALILTSYQFSLKIFRIARARLRPTNVLI
jgi:hypothetical protein